MAPKESWTQEEIDAHEARGGAWGSTMGRPIPGIDYSSLPAYMQPLPTSRDWGKYSAPEDDEDE